MTIQEAERIARDAVTIMRSRAQDAVRYSEAYEQTTCTLVLDGSQLSPSTRALPGAESVFQASYEAPELWEAFGWIADRIEDIEIPDGRTDEPHPDCWTVAWEDGCLFAYAPEHDSETA